MYDVNGRLVRTLQPGTLAAGVHALDWDGRDPSGAHVPAGVMLRPARTAGTVAAPRSS